MKPLEQRVQDAGKLADVLARAKAAPAVGVAGQTMTTAGENLVCLQTCYFPQSQQAEVKRLVGAIVDVYRSRRIEELERRLQAIIFPPEEQESESQ